ncbi:hypothetical protein CMI47_04885 [Candidatus Pacearchaeota archaeon]|jgi:hypothetical protein|nr:hypothetical protein [Candidatus Pacearchaeota archaeon]|tara:strand:+ start:629 stop:1126 length:498 start_codon:yes stop_codon:yes gene_type:complete
MNNVDQGIVSPVIGIPNWWWKKKVAKFMKVNQNIHIVSIKDFCHECSRHFEMLSLFDSGDSSFRDTEYYQYQIKGKKKKAVMKKISDFKKLYINIANSECKEPPIVTQDGCRIDGSHRMAILLHIGIVKYKINVVKYDLLFSNEECCKIKSQVREYRENVYGFSE